MVKEIKEEVASSRARQFRLNIDAQSAVIDSNKLNRIDQLAQDEKHLQPLSSSISHNPLRPTSAENLNWNFFEHISSCDNILRGDERNCGLQAVDRHLIVRPQTHRVDASLPAPNGICDELKHSNLNGFVLPAHSTDDIFPQYSPDLIEPSSPQPSTPPPPLSLQSYPIPFQFTSPSTTFKRHQAHGQQRQQHQQHQQQQLKAERITSAVSTAIKVSPPSSRSPTPFPERQQRYAAALGSESRVSGRDSARVITVATTANGIDVSVGTGTVERQPKRHTHSPSLRQPDSIEGFDLVGDTRHQRCSNDYERNISLTYRMAGRSAGSAKDGSQSPSQSFIEGLETQLSLYGWRKKCLFALLTVLSLLIVTNLVLILWILQVMEFTPSGMGLLKIVPGGIQLNGQALVMDTLRVSTIRSRHGQPIVIESSRNFSINTRDANGMLENHLFLGHDKLECLTSSFRINDTAGRNLFSVNRDEVTIGAHSLRIDGEGGAIFRESIQTPHVRADPGRELKLESPTRQLEMNAAKDITLTSRAGGIEISALEDVKLSAIEGSVRFESPRVFMPNLRTAQLPLPGAPTNREHTHRVFQLCACGNGKLFLAAPHAVCAADDSTVCR